MSKVKNFKAMKKKWLSDPAVADEYNALSEEFQVAEEIIKARSRAHLSQSELAKRIGTKAPAISRLESPGYGRASVSVLKKVAHALDCELKIQLIPKKG